MTGLEKFLVIASFGVMGLGSWGASKGWVPFASGARDVYRESIRRSKRVYGSSTRVGSRRHGRTYHTGGKHW